MRIRPTLAVLLVAASCSSGAGSGTSGVGGAGNAGGATAGSGGGGACPAEVPVYSVPFPGATNAYESCCPPAANLHTGASCGTKNLLCWATQQTALGCPGAFQYACNGTTFSATTMHIDPPTTCPENTGTGGAGATTGSGGTGGTGGSSGGDGTAGSGGAGNAAGTTGGSGGACPAELPPSTTVFPTSTSGYESCCSGVAFGAPCTTKNLLCAVQEPTALGCPGVFQYKCDGTAFVRTLAHIDPPTTCTGTGGTGGRGGTGGSGGTAGSGGSAGTGAGGVGG